MSMYDEHGIGSKPKTPSAIPFDKVTQNEPIDFTQFGQKQIKDIDSGVSGGISVVKPKHTQKNNDKAIRKGTGMKTAFERGFLKAAQEAGLTEGQSVELLKSSGPLGFIDKFMAKNMGVPMAENMLGAGEGVGANTLQKATEGGFAGGGMGGGLGALLGGGLGAGAGYLTGSEDSKGKSTKGRNAAIGALAGAGLGGTLGGAAGGGLGAATEGSQGFGASLVPLKALLFQQQQAAGQ